jgi:foldase protein PrsA
MIDPDKEGKESENSLPQEESRESAAAAASPDGSDGQAAERAEEIFSDPADRDAAPRPASAGKAAAAATRRGSSWPWMTVAVVAVAALAFVLIRNPQGSAMNETVGTMDGVTFTKADLYDEMVRNIGQDQAASMLDSLMTLKLVELEAGKSGDITDADIQKELDKTKKQFASEEAFNQALAQSGMSLESLKEQIKTQLELRKIFEPQIAPKEADLQKYYNDNKESFGTPEQIKASHIVLGTKEDAQAVLKQLKDGADFAMLARQKSEDASTKDNGGDMGYVSRGMLDPQLEEAAFKLDKNEFSDVVQTSSGYEIVKVTDKKPAQIPPYDEVKEDVKNRYIDEQMQSKIPAWLEQAKKDYHYVNKLQSAASEPAAGAPAASAPAASAPAGSAQAGQ